MAARPAADPRRWPSWPGSAGSWSCRCPTSRTSGRPLRRWMLLADAFPEVVPGVRFEQSHLGNALLELSHVENLPQRLPIVLAAALIAALGDRPGTTRAPVAWPPPDARAAGAARAGLRPGSLRPRGGDPARRPARLSRPLAGPGRLWACPILLEIGLGVVGAWGSGRRTTVAPIDLPRRPKPHDPQPDSIGFGLVAGPFLLVMALGAMLPTIDFDAIEYHLQGPKEYYQAGRIAFLPHNVYTSMPFGVEMLHLLGMEVLDDWWWGALVGQLLVACFAPAAAVLIAATARRWGSPRAAWFAARRLPDDPLGLPAGGIALCRRTALRLPRGLDLGAGPGLDVDRRGAAPGAALGRRRAARRRGDGLQVPCADLGGHPVRAARPGRLGPAAVGVAAPGLRRRAGERS